MELAELLETETDDPDALVDWAKERANQFLATLDAEDDLVGLLQGLRLDVPALLNGEPGTAARRPNPPIPRPKPASLRMAEEQAAASDDDEEIEEIEELDADELEELDMDELELIDEDEDEDDAPVQSGDTMTGGELVEGKDPAPVRTGGTDVQAAVDEPIAEDDGEWADEDDASSEDDAPIRTGGTDAQPVVDEPIAQDDEFDDLDPNAELEDEDEDDDDDIDIDVDLD